MSEKRKSIQDEERKSKQHRRHEVTIEEMNTSGDDNDEHIQTTTLIPYAKDDMLCVFPPPSSMSGGDSLTTTTTAASTLRITWLDKVVYNLQHKNNSVLAYNGHQYLTSGLDELNNTDNLQEWHSRLYPDIDKDIVIVEPVGAKTTYNIGRRVRGKPSGFVFIDYGRIKRAKSVHGNFFTIQWNNIYYHNKIFGQIMERYFNDDLPFKLETSVCINLPDKPRDRELLLRKFYSITRENNMNTFATGQLNHPVQVERFTEEQFDTVFEMNDVVANTSNEVEMIICAVIEGVKAGKIETSMTDLNNKKITSKVYSLAVKPVLFFYVEP
jgi:hypothetical protein